MNRKYKTEEYMDLINKLRDNIPNLAVTTDIIVGFPTETEADFEEEIEVIKSQFSRTTCFPIFY